MLLACSLQKHVFLLSITAKQNVAENVKKKKRRKRNIPSWKGWKMDDYAIYNTFLFFSSFQTEITRT